jgi:hypothetical protein
MEVINVVDTRNAKESPHGTMLEQKSQASEPNWQECWGEEDGVYQMLTIP